MSKLVIVYDCPEDGRAKVVIPSPEALRRGVSLSDIAAKAIPKEIPYRITTLDKLPKDREFRNAWTDKLPTESVDVDIDKAKEIHVGRLRKIRDKKLEKLDLELMRALEDDDKVKLKEIKAKKQALRDMPANLNLKNINNPDDLKLVKPKILD